MIFIHPLAYFDGCERPQIWLELAVKRFSNFEEWQRINSCLAIKNML
jgi:hypothetical protein